LAKLAFDEYNLSHIKHSCKKDIPGLMLYALKVVQEEQNIDK
jgi:hypothetical protein